jgi:hypothetical protein
MKYLFVALLGLIVGALLGAVLLYFNPFSAGSAAQPNATDRVLHYSMPDDVLELALGADARLFGQDAGDGDLWEDTINSSAVLGLALKDDADQPVGIASRLMTVSDDTNLLLRGVLVSDHWLVTIPGEGTLFVRAESNAWPFVKQTLLPAWYLERPWQGPELFWPTVGPRSDESAIVVGVAGSLRGRDGTAVERYELTALDPARRSALAEGELHLALPGPQVATQEQ